MVNCINVYRSSSLTFACWVAPYDGGLLSIFPTRAFDEGVGVDGSHCTTEALLSNRNKMSAEVDKHISHSYDIRKRVGKGVSTL